VSLGGLVGVLGWGFGSFAVVLEDEFGGGPFEGKTPASPGYRHFFILDEVNEGLPPLRVGVGYLRSDFIILPNFRHFR
jgi:hypothetical protein